MENRYELVVIWATGEKQVFSYKTAAEAEEAEKGYKMAFGQQVAYTCVNRKG